MLAVVVGNSNCVLRRGFGESLADRFVRAGHEVVNLSIGGSCSLYHIYAWHERRELLAAADLVLLDSMIIDAGHRRLRLLSADQARRAIDDMYALYSSLPGRVVSVFFPTRTYVTSFRELEVYRFHCDSASRHGVDVLDIYREVERQPAAPAGLDRLFRNSTHLRPRYGAAIAGALSDHLLEPGSAPAGRPPTARTVMNTPYLVASIEEEPFAGLARVVHSTHYMTRTAAVVDRELPLERFAGLRAMGAFHWNKAGESRLAIRGRAAPYVKQLRGEYALFAAFTAEPMIDSDDRLDRALAPTPVTEPPRIEGAVLEPHLLGLLFKRPGADVVVGPPGDVSGDLTPLIEGLLSPG